MDSSDYAVHRNSLLKQFQRHAMLLRILSARSIMSQLLLEVAR